MYSSGQGFTYVSSAGVLPTVTKGKESGMVNRRNVLRIRMLALGCEIAGVMLLQWTLRAVLSGDGFRWVPTLAGIALVALGILLFFARVSGRGQ